MALLKLKSAELRETLPCGKTGNESGASPDALRINLRYPVFEGENRAVCEKLCGFYAAAADGYARFCRKKAVRQKSGKDGTERGADRGASMNWYVSFLNESLLSMLVDAAFFDGEKKRTARFVHNWNLNDGTPFYAKQAFSTTRGAKEKILAEICRKITLREGGFPYRRGAEAAARTHFRFENYYFTAKGVAFYYEKGLLFDSDSVNPSFVVPFSQIDGATPLCRNGSAEA